MHTFFTFLCIYSPYFLASGNLWDLVNWQAFLNLQGRAIQKSGGSKTSFIKATTTTVHHAINESEKASYVAHINSYLAEDKFLKDYLPIDPATNELFEVAKNGVLLWFVHWAKLTMHCSFFFF